MKVIEETNAQIAGEAIEAKNILIGNCFYTGNVLYMRIIPSVHDEGEYVKAIALDHGSVARIPQNRTVRTASAEVMVHGIVEEEENDT